MLRKWTILPRPCAALLRPDAVTVFLAFRPLPSSEGFTVLYVRGIRRGAESSSEREGESPPSEKRDDDALGEAGRRRFFFGGSFDELLGLVFGEDWVFLFGAVTFLQLFGDLLFGLLCSASSSPPDLFLR